MCDRLKVLIDVGEDGFWDTTDVVTSGQIDGVDYLFHEEPAPDLIADEKKVCILDAVKNSPILGDSCFNCAKLIFLRKKANLKQSNS
ncbi:hypothetical protein KBD45_07845 [Candidatus Dojkabacteria bacterium]|nr:hypothetical protein [Candidatus Dojkabacteria bacterium]